MMSAAEKLCVVDCDSRPAAHPPPNDRIPRQVWLVQFWADKSSNVQAKIHLRFFLSIHHNNRKIAIGNPTQNKIA
jgi:hypothetical protein